MENLEVNLHFSGVKLSEFQVHFARNQNDLWMKSSDYSVEFSRVFLFRKKTLDTHTFFVSARLSNYRKRVLEKKV